MFIFKVINCQKTNTFYEINRHRINFVEADTQVSTNLFLHIMEQINHKECL